jgi:transposase-like protein
MLMNPIMAAALGRMASIKCPHCGRNKVVERIPKEFRVCPRCHKHFPDPIKTRRKAKR